MLDFTGRTALVTGASAGIGREIARLLAREVGTLALVARRQERLDELERELTRARPNLRVVTRAADLGSVREAGAMLDGLTAAGVEVDILINNAGIGLYGLFEETDWARVERMLQLNMVTATYLIHCLVPPMVTRGFGAILNVGSMAGVTATPKMAAYGATKAYLNHLSDGLRAELSGTGVVITTLAPGPVPTEFQEVAGMRGARRPTPEFLKVSAEACAAQALDGLKRRKARVVPGPLGLAVAPLEAVPKAVLRPILGQVGKRMRQGR